MLKYLGFLSEGMNSLVVAGLAGLALAATPGFAFAQDAALPPELVAGQHEALNGLSVKDIKLSGDLLYQASDDDLQPVPSKMIRRLDKQVCMVSEDDKSLKLPEGYDAVGGNSVDQLATKYLPDPSLIILLRVERKFDSSSVICGTLEFSYVQKNDLPTPAATAPAPAPKKKG